MILLQEKLSWNFTNSSCTGGGYEQTGRNSSKENQSQDPQKLIFQLCRQRLFLEIIHSKVVEHIKSIKVAC
jgi:hypothetical protein